MAKNLVYMLTLLIIAGIAAAAAPGVSLFSPNDGSTSDTGNVTFGYIVTGSDIIACSLYTNLTGSWAIDQTNSTGPYSQFTKNNIADNLDFKWNVRCTNNLAESSFAASNRTISVKINDAPYFVTPISNQAMYEDNATLQVVDLTTKTADADNDTMSYSVSYENLSQVDCNILANNTLTVTPAADYFGTAICTIKVSDPKGAYSQQNFSTTVYPVNDRPTITVPSQILVENKSSTINLSAYAYDKESTTLYYFVNYHDPNKVSCNVQSNNLVMQPAPGYKGSAYCTVSAFDGTEYSELNNFTMNVEESNAVINFLEGTSPSLTLIRGVGNKAEIDVKIKNVGNVDLSSVQVAASNLIGPSTLSNSYVNVPASFSLAKDAEYSFKITINYPGTGLEPGIYSGNYSVTYGSSVATQFITLTVRDPSAVLLLPDEVLLGNVGDDRNKSVTTTFTIKNNGASGDLTIRNINISGDADSKYNLTFKDYTGAWVNSITVSTLAIGQSYQVEVQGIIPIKEDSGKTDIGNIKITSDQINTSITNVFMYPESKLEIYDFDIKAGSNSKDMENGDTIDGVKPGDEIEVQVQVKNLFTRDEDLDINDVTVLATLEDIDDGDDDEEESEQFDLSPQERDTVTLKFQVPKGVDEGKYTLKVVVEGDDDNDAKHTVEWEVYLKVEKKKHEVEIQEAYLSSPTLTCSRNTMITITVANIGSTDEDEVKVTAQNSDLKFYVKREEVELNNDYEDDDNKLTFTEEIMLPENLKKGLYPIKVSVYYDKDKLDDEVIVNLMYDGCGDDEGSDDNSGSSDDTSSTSSSGSNTGTSSSGSSTSTAAQPVYVTSGDQGFVTATPSYAAQQPSIRVVDTSEVSFTESTGYVLLLVVLNVVVIGGAAVLVWKFLV